MVLFLTAEPLTVLCAHTNIYPTSLAPLVLIDVAECLLSWLEQLLKDEIVRQVKKRRRIIGSSTKSTRRQDSKRESPRKKKGQVMRPIGEAKKAIVAVG